MIEPADPPAHIKQKDNPPAHIKQKELFRRILRTGYNNAWVASCDTLLDKAVIRRTALGGEFGRARENEKLT